MKKQLNTAKRRRGGRRPGSGRPRGAYKRDWWTTLSIGQACEVLWREASDQAVADRLESLLGTTEIRALQNGAQTIPEKQRKTWRTSEAYKDHSGDLEAWLHKRAGTPFNDTSGKYMGKAPRVVSVSTTPYRGTSKRIMDEVAARYGVSVHVVKRLWVAYRKFEREAAKGDSK